MFINNLRNLQNFHIYIYYLCIFFVIWLFKIDFQRYVYYTLTRKSVSRYERRMAETVWNEEGGEGKRKRRFPVVGRKGTREKRAKKRKCCKAWERASPLAERGHPRSRERERERISQTGLRFHPSPKTHPNFHPRSTPGRLDAQRWPPSWLGGHRVPR